jgi:PPOX class probable F420-dependent enzyme
MANPIPDKYKDLFEKKAFGHLATLMPDGTPQVTPVWIDYDGTHIIVNSARGRQKDKNMKRNPHVSISVQDPDNPYRYLEIRGKVTEITETGADDSIDKLAKKYTGADKYQNRRAGEVRVIYKVTPDHTTAMG